MAPMKTVVAKAVAEPTSTAIAAAAESIALTARGPRYARLSFAVSVLAAIAIVGALYLARAFFVPLLIGILATYTLSPLVEWLKACRLPRAIGAALVLGVLMGGLSWIAFSLSDDTASVIEKMPEAARKLRQNLIDSRAGGPTPLQNIQEAANEIQAAAADAGAKRAVHV